MEFEKSTTAEIQVGRLSFLIEGVKTEYKLKPEINRNKLAKAVSSVLCVLADHLGGSKSRLSSFQTESIIATLCGLYSTSYKSRYAAHVITAGVGSGKSFAFQVGALIHVAYRALMQKKGICVLLLYPRVALAGNQFKDLFKIVDLLSDELGVQINYPCLDAGGQIQRQMGMDSMEAGATFKAIQKAYNGEYPILISNLDTLANRLVHPESCRGLTKDLDLIVLDEIHLLSGLYGAHAKMVMKRLELMRSMWKLREENKTWEFGKLISRQKDVPSVYLIGASATISEPSLHTARIIDRGQEDVLHISVKSPNETGWVHHIFLRQRYEASSMSSLVNATSCLIHNRSNGIFRDLYELFEQERISQISLDQLGNPIQPHTNIKLRKTENIHKTIGFSDSLDNIGRWADLVSDNEKTKVRGMLSSANLGVRSFPYFLRFQEPLWRVIHHASFSRNPALWQQIMREYYGRFCRDCKKGVKRSIIRIPAGLSAVQKRKIDELWDFRNNTSYLHKLGVGDEYIDSPWFGPLLEASHSERLINLDGCPFFQSCLCWWWSMDHAGNNAPSPASNNTPLNGYKMPGYNPGQYYHCVNGIRVSSFTSNTDFDVMALNTINDVFQRKANSVFRDTGFNNDQLENTNLIIGSPRLEVGVDLTRVRDGITFQAMRDPASLQQKVGRIGREQSSDSMIVHLVTQNTRDQYYFRNPHIALDTEYLQPIPMHEDNRIVARHHFFMAIIDFLCLQGANPGKGAVADDGDRLDLINDHKYTPSFSNWAKKINAVYEFLFGSHPEQQQNLKNLTKYLKSLGAKSVEL
ncbi:DEAD/DEAH box helicase, partial [Thermodesulfobacteriota bacterium]